MGKKKKKKSKKSEFAQRLAQGNAEWKNAPKGGFRDCEAGHYTFLMEEAKLFFTKSNNELMLRIKWVVAQGERKGDQVTDFFSLDNEDRLPMLKARLDDLGYDIPDNKAAIEEIVADLNREPPVIDADVVKSKPNDNGQVFTNLRNIVLIDDADLAAGSAADDEEPEESDEESDEVEDEESEDDEASDEASFDEGDRVTFTDDDGDEHSGEVQSVDDGTARVEDDEGGEWDIPVADLSAEDADASDSDDDDDDGEEEEEEGEDEEDEQKAALLTLADAHDVEVDEDDDVDDIVKTMKEAKWVKDELAEDEIEVLKQAGIKVSAKPKPKKAKKGKAKKGKKGKKKR